MNYTKMLMSALMAMILIVSIASFTLAKGAQASVDTNLTGSANANPDSALYGLKMGWEDVKLAFTFNQHIKAEKELELARERLLEAKIMAEMGNEKGFEKAQKRHDKLIERAEKRLERIDGDGNSSKILDSAVKLKGLEVAVEAHDLRIQRLKEFVAGANLTDEQTERFNEIISKMEEKNSEMREKLEERQDRIETKLRAVTEKNESEVENEVRKMNASTNFTANLEVIAKIRIEKAEDVLDKMKERLSEGDFNKTNVTLVEQRIAKAEIALNEAKALYAQGKYKEAISKIREFGNYGRNWSEIVKLARDERKEVRENLSDDLKEIRKNAREAAKEEIEDARERLKNLTGDDDDDDEDDDSINLSVNVSTGVSA